MGDDVVIGLLRAVNVGGRTLTSAVLRATASDLGYRDVATYAASGNVVLRAAHGAPQVAADLGAALTTAAGFEVRVVTRTSRQWDRAVAALPFADAARDDPARLALVAWDGPVDTTRVDAFDPARYGPEQLAWHGSELYAYYPDGMGRSRLTLPVLERAAGRTGTSRNWRTVLALAALAHERAGA